MLGIPLAAGVFIPLLHWQMNPMYGAAAMSLSSFCVVSNALRLNLFDIRSTKHDHKRKNTQKQAKKENTTMNKTIKIEGMMCGHCEATVKKGTGKRWTVFPPPKVKPHRRYRCCNAG